MKKIALFLLFTSSFALLSFQQDTIVDFLHTGTILKFEDHNFHLAWSSHPNTTYYKQEYLRTSDNKFETYQKMLIVEAVQSDILVEQASNMKLNELEKLKKDNPLVQTNIEKANNQDEKVISFMLSGGHNVLEWNIYRYQQQKNDRGTFLVLYAYSYRNYFTKKEDIVKFLEYVKANNSKITNLVNSAAVPKIKVD
ncbi:hypothetical protein FFWV33_11380 [Flavobacterium faecale]|uniref:PsbP C-terminal domain-containing protein n=1 Tax=Flavobacterium faecale TaxID=1355330 RepID=A0A2S1LED8_9FLAO|nr:hypothetical protein [Flavobacterium faecale]AWG22069.1 hypothetical protein FFWV33_11380 [Flavobacterium faecale]